ncbi:Rab GTPase binding protein [Fragilaria crotonensis]|nr:Rab GTPase binding protein [Fragilaria crotonensis]
MTLVFFVALTSNLSAYLRADNLDEFEYDVGHLVRAMSVCFGFVFGAPALWWLVTQCVGMQALMLVDWICLYGYSMVAYLPATILCLIPWHPWMWICLTVATAMSGLLVVRNVAAPLLAADSTANKAGPILLAVIASHLIFLLVLKIVFYE